MNIYEGYQGIDYENGREHLSYRLGNEEFYAIELNLQISEGNVYFGKRDFDT